MQVLLTVVLVALLVLLVAVILLARQVGYLLNLAGPVGARAMRQGPRVGENIAEIVRGTSLLPSLPVADRPILYVFLSHSCGICGVVRSACEAIARHWSGKADLVLVYDATATSVATPQRIDPSLQVVHSPTLREELSVGSVPFAVVVSSAQKVIASGLINNSSHIESLLEAASQRSLP